MALSGLLGAPGALAAEDMVVFAAASLSDVLEELAPAYRAASGIRLVVNAGASSDLARQIRAGAAADLFFSADRAQMDVLEQSGVVREQDRIDVLSNLLAVVVPADSGATPASALDMVRLRRIAMADPEGVPAGVYGRVYLQSLGLWERLRGRVVPTLDVRAALAAVASGDADAGIVYRTDAQEARGVRVAFEVPRTSGPPIVYVLAPLARSQKAAASGLASFLASESAAAVYQRHGFIVLTVR